MDEAWVRLSVVAGALVVASVAVALLRIRARRRPETVESAGMVSGIYLFTSSTCLDCAPARRSLQDALGADGFTEINWEEQPGTFHELGITAVPATLIVGEPGDATLYPGQPDEALLALSP